eukprot:evm.model.scf_839.3 EVM.evm.TU.scf_839.3   scf_839:21858-24977(-)
MSDVYDVLGVQRGSERPDAPPKAKEPKVKRPEGMSREAFSLLDGQHPIMQSGELGLLARGESRKRRAEGNYRISYVWKRFKNQAREDGMELSHWTKCYRDVAGNVREAEEGDYPFAKFNRHVALQEYNDEEWAGVVTREGDGWGREETDYLMEMCGRFDLRFTVIADRWDFKGGPPRTLEELKDRYYTVSRRLLVSREASEAAVANHILIKHAYNLEYEKDRRRACEGVFKKTAKDEAEETGILEEASKIEERRRHEATARRQETAGVSAYLLHPDEFSNTTPPGTSSLFDANLEPCRPPPGVYSRSLHTKDVAKSQLVRMTGGPKAQKLVESTLRDLGCSSYPRMATRAEAGAWLALHAEIINLVETKKKASG